jgi:glycosyltransferase involved in cell wall biosynthesis
MSTFSRLDADSIDHPCCLNLACVSTDAERLRILLTVHHVLDVDSGAPGATHRLADEYRKLGHDVAIFSLDDLPPRLPVKAKELLFPLFVAFRIRSAQKSEPLHIVDASTGDAWLWSLFRRRGTGRPLLVTRSHGLEHMAHFQRLEESRRGHLHLSWKYPLYRGGLHLAEVSCSLRRADLVLLLNRQDRAYATDRLAVDLRRIRLVAHGLPDEFIGLPLEPTPLERGSEIAIAQIGTYDVYKGTRYSARALMSTLESHPEARVSFLGAGCPTERVLSDFPASFHSRIRVVPRYQRSRLPALLAGHQIKLFPTLSEGFGLALLEAMACGLAPVVTSTPGPLRIVRSERDALVVPTRDSDAIVRALHRLITDRTLLDRLRRNAHAAAQGYRWSTVAAETISTYKEFLAARDAAARGAALDTSGARGITGANRSRSMS